MQSNNNLTAIVISIIGPQVSHNQRNKAVTKNLDSSTTWQTKAFLERFSRTIRMCTCSARKNQVLRRIEVQFSASTVATTAKSKLSKASTSTVMLMDKSQETTIKPAYKSVQILLRIRSLRIIL